MKITKASNSAAKKEKPKRLKPLPEVLRELFLLSGNECAMANCKTVLVDQQGTMIGEVAHTVGIEARLAERSIR